MKHELKTLPIYFQRSWEQGKTFEVRLNDRDFQKGDKILLKEYDGTNYTGREILGEILYVLSDFDGLQKDYVIFSFCVDQYFS